MDELMRVQTLLTHSGCPTCGKRSFDMHLRCDLEEKDCLYVATCTGCDERFNVTRPRDRAAAGRPCPCCTEGHMEQAVLCESATRECRVVWHCSQCGQTDARLVGA